MTPPPSRARSALVLAGFLALSFAAAAVGSVGTARSVSSWYACLEKPWWTPPGWVFGPVWTALYVLMSVAAWLTWRHGEGAARRRALAWWGLQLALNAAWSWLFFGLRAPALGVAGILLLWMAIMGATGAMGRAHPPASRLMAPYVLWVTFAAALNVALWYLN